MFSENFRKSFIELEIADKLAYFILSNILAGYTLV